jgi:hypothetical protein
MFEKKEGDKVLFLDAKMEIIKVEGKMIGNRKITLVNEETGEIITNYS